MGLLPTGGSAPKTTMLSEPQTVIFSEQMNPSVDVRDVRKVYRTRTGLVQAIEDVSFDVKRGEFVSFGVRGEYYPEDFLVAWAARRLGRPVSWIEDRREHFLATNHSREQYHRAAIAGDEDGKIRALRSEFWVDLGAYVRTVGLRLPALTLATLPGPYDVAAYQGVAHCVVTNRTPTGSCRSPGRFESCFVRERLIDLYAAHIGLSPLEVRRRNLIQKQSTPYRRALFPNEDPVLFQPGDYVSLLKRAEEAIDQAELAARRERGERVGLGFSMYLDESGLGPSEVGSVTVEPDGTVTVRSGCTWLGQGLRTVLSQIVADALDIDPSAVYVAPVDTDLLDGGTGTFASRSTVAAGNAVHLATSRLLDRARDAAARWLEADPTLLVRRRGGLEVRGRPSRRLSLAEVVARLALPYRESGNSRRGLSAQAVFQVQSETYAAGAVAAIVRVDPETGHVHAEKLVLVHDAGRVVNPVLLAGQFQGGAVQGLGGTLLENLRYNGDANPLATTFMDYLLPTSADTPTMEVILDQGAPVTTNPLGLKGGGESGVTGVPAAVAGAIEDALETSGIILRTPVTPEEVRAAVAASRASPARDTGGCAAEGSSLMLAAHRGREDLRRPGTRGVGGTGA